MNHLILFTTAVTTALVAGLLYGYSCSVNPALSSLTDYEYLKAMQQINSAILNPWFFMTFTGSLLLLPVSVWMQARSGDTTGFYFQLAATLLYLAGVFGVTIFGNVPLNQQLANTDLQSSSAQIMHEMRRSFEVPWGRFHQLRTWASILTLICVIISCIQIHPIKVIQ